MLQYPYGTTLMMSPRLPMSESKSLRKEARIPNPWRLQLGMPSPCSFFLRKEMFRETLVNEILYDYNLSMCFVMHHSYTHTGTRLQPSVIDHPIAFPYRRMVSLSRAAKQLRARVYSIKNWNCIQPLIVVKSHRLGVHLRIPTVDKSCPPVLHT